MSEGEKQEPDSFMSGVCWKDPADHMVTSSADVFKDTSKRV